MLKLEFKEAAAVLIVVSAAFLFLALTGTNPLNPSATLQTWARVILGVLGVGSLFVGRLISPRTESQNVHPPSPEYMERFEQAQKRIASIRPEFKCLVEVDGPTKFSIENGDIRETKSDVVVTSDDNRLSALGGWPKRFSLSLDQASYSNLRNTGGTHSGKGTLQ